MKARVKQAGYTEDKLCGFICSSWSSYIHHASIASRWKREHITIALGDLNTELKVQLTGPGVPMTPYTLLYNLEAWDRGVSFTPVGAEQE